MEDRLQKFARVVETGSITKAARELRISQPALSSALHKLERELKTQLVTHVGRNIQITAAGRLVYRTASGMRIQLQNLSQDLAQLSKQKPTVRIGMIDSIAQLLCITGDLLPRLEASADTSLVVNNSAYLVRAVSQGELDIAFVAWQSQPAAILEWTRIGNEPLVLVARSSEKASIQPQLQQGKVPNFLAYNPSSNTFRLIAEHMAKQGLEVDTSFYSTSPEVILQLVLAGRGTAVLPLQMVRNDIKSGILTQITKNIIKRPIVAVQEKGRATPAYLALCLSQARHALTELTTIAGDQR